MKHIKTITKDEIIDEYNSRKNRIDTGKILTAFTIIGAGIGGTYFTRDMSLCLPTIVLGVGSAASFSYKEVKNEQWYTRELRSYRELEHIINPESVSD